MSRVSKIQYNPALSVAKNAEDNSVSKAAIRYYIKVNGIDRRTSKKERIIAKCKGYLKKHPNASINEISKNTKYSRSTISGYWKYINGTENLTEFNKNKAEIRQGKLDSYKAVLSKLPLSEIDKYLAESASKKNKTITANRYELWSDVLKEIPEVLKEAEEIDIAALKEFIMAKPEMPMLFVGSGGQNGAFPAFLYGMNKGIGVAMTPLQFASLSDATVKNSRIMLLSKSGGNDDIKYASLRAVELNPENTACITFKDTPENCLLKNLKDTSAKIFLFDEEKIKSGFTSVRGKFLKYAMSYRVFSGVDNVASLLNVDLEPVHCFTCELNKVKDESVNLERVEHFCVLYGGYGEPVAQDFESVMTEAGVASVQVCDYRNYCHGRFIFPTNHTENDKEPRFYTNVAMVLFVSPRERNLAERIRELAIPSRTPVITIESEFDSALASLDMLVKSSVLIGYIGEQVQRINPYSPPNYHAEDVDKRKPINSIKFITELRNNGELLYVEGQRVSKPKKKAKKGVNVDELKALIDEYKEAEE